MHLQAERFVFFFSLRPWSGISERESRLIKWHQCRLFTRQRFSVLSVFTFIVFGNPSMRSCKYLHKLFYFQFFSSASRSCSNIEGKSSHLFSSHRCLVLGILILSLLYRSLSRRATRWSFAACPRLRARTRARAPQARRTLGGRRASASGRAPTTIIETADRRTRRLPSRPRSPRPSRSTSKTFPRSSSKRFIPFREFSILFHFR